MPRSLWHSLVLDLSARGNGVRESGAFLLGYTVGRRREVTDYALYDDLEPGCLDSGFINFSSYGYRRLWARLEDSGLSVVADIHTHPGDAFLSDVDRENPMMPNQGHIALILPQYARGNPGVAAAALSIFQGGGKWLEFAPGHAREKMYVGFWS